MENPTCCTEKVHNARQQKSHAKECTHALVQRVSVPWVPFGTGRDNIYDNVVRDVARYQWNVPGEGGDCGKFCRRRKALFKYKGNDGTSMKHGF